MFDIAVSISKTTEPDAHRELRGDGDDGGGPRLLLLPHLRGPVASPLQKTRHRCSQLI
jgi:hypothetical protein